MKSMSTDSGRSVTTRVTFGGAVLRAERTADRIGIRLGWPAYRAPLRAWRVWTRRCARRTPAAHPPHPPHLPLMLRPPPLLPLLPLPP
ncbi:acetyltransferase, GNAT family domain protein [Burkholderia mallei]|nr:acetyltransferase, GNAT family domain protein [Burkholderia mallei]KOS76392.1 acetyltransferase, GNAT family domain protein [Burkholderia mallei]KOS90817.1 acetyltransferase, GNAT family domain protein [Burkholderia mallei]KOS92902.1 acetyltransferase, GNAT family domain protein [Burkholderia mallei]KOT01860.1 acetyltransferase, GNAT family domain protein [Burkholderia mallei]